MNNKLHVESFCDLSIDEQMEICGGMGPLEVGLAAMAIVQFVYWVGEAAGKTYGYYKKGY